MAYDEHHLTPQKDAEAFQPIVLRRGTVICGGVRMVRGDLLIWADRHYPRNSA